MVRIDGNDVICTVQQDAILGENKGVNLPGTSMDLPAMTEKDREDLVFGCQQKFDFVAASFVRNATDVELVREVLRENNGHRMKIFSKVRAKK